MDVKFCVQVEFHDDVEFCWNWSFGSKRSFALRWRIGRRWKFRWNQLSGSFEWRWRRQAEQNFSFQDKSSFFFCKNPVFATNW